MRTKVSYFELLYSNFMGFTSSELINYLIESHSVDFDIDEIDSDGETILINITTNENLDHVKFLVENGVDVNKVDGKSDYALLVAANSGWQEGFDYLYPLTNPHIYQDYSIHEILTLGITNRQRRMNTLNEQFISNCNYGNVNNVIEMISQGIDVNIIGSCGYTALQKALPNLEIVDILINAKADVNNKGDMDETPLLMAIGMNTENEIIDLLLRAGANINSSSGYNGFTPLMKAISNVNVEATKLLIDRGCDIKAKDNYGRSALDIASEILQSQVEWVKMQEDLPKIINLLREV